MQKSAMIVVLISLTSVAMFAIDFETIFRDLTDPVEVVFVMDTSGSMGHEIAGVRDNVIGFAEELADSGYSYRFGATTFGDGNNTWDFDPLTPGFNMTDDVVTFRDQVALTGSSGGGDTPETQIDAMYEAATFYDWTPGLLHVLIMFTNSDFHYPGDGFGYSTVSSEDLITHLVTEGFLAYTSFPTSFHSPLVPDADEIYQLIADTTGGCSFPLGSRAPVSWDAIFDRILSDAMRYYSISTTITGLSGHVLEEIELDYLNEFTTFGPRTIDLSGPEYMGVDEIYIAWTMQLTGPSTSGTPYVITLRTDLGEFIDYDIVYYQVPVRVHENSTTPDVFALTAYPNPFNSAVAISAPASAVIEIFDLNGRSVAKLPGGEQIWTPEPTEGSGVYLVRAVSPDGTCSDTKRAVYLK